MYNYLTSINTLVSNSFSVKIILASSIGSIITFIFFGIINYPLLHNTAFILYISNHCIILWFFNLAIRLITLCYNLLFSKISAYLFTIFYLFNIKSLVCYFCVFHLQLITNERHRFSVVEYCPTDGYIFVYSYSFHNMYFIQLK